MLTFRKIIGATALLMLVLTSQVANGLEFDFAGGVALPVGLYGDKDFDGRRAGGATVGVSVAASAWFPLSGSLGMFGGYRFYANEADFTAMEEAITSDQPLDSINADAQSYLVHSFLYGPSWTSTYAKPEIRLYGGVGYTLSFNPQVIVQVSRSGQTGEAVLERGNGQAVSLLFGGTAKYVIGNKVALQIGLELFYANVTFEDLKVETVSLDGNWSEFRTDLNQPITILSVPVGVSIWL